MFTSTTTDSKEQGHMMETQSESRERWIKELAKRASISSTYYREWAYSHQTRGDTLSQITAVTVTQPWQRSQLLDYVKKEGNNTQERFFITKSFGECTEKKRKQIKVQPQISLWDRTTRTMAQEYGIPFKQNWKDLT